MEVCHQYLHLSFYCDDRLKCLDKGEFSGWKSHMPLRHLFGLVLLARSWSNVKIKTHKSKTLLFFSRTVLPVIMRAVKLVVGNKSDPLGNLGIK